MGASLGHDSDLSMAAAANAVRALRQAGKQADADAFATEWKVAEEQMPDEFGAVSEQLEAAFEEVWKGTSAKGSLDPSGFLREAGMR